MDTNYFEVVVCGPDLAGLIAASLLSRRGQRVLLCGHDRMPPTFQAGPYTLAREPGFLPPPDSEPVARVLRELGLAQVVRRRAPGQQPALQIILPQHRMEFGSDPEAADADLRREFPDDFLVIREILTRLGANSSTLDPLLGSDITLPPHGFWERRDVGRIQSQLPPLDGDWVSGLAAYHPMRAALTALGALSSHFSPSDLSGMAQARAYDLSRRGVYRLGGLDDIWSLFEQKVETLSGEVRENLVPVEIAWKRGRAAGLRVRTRNETIGLGQLVWAGSATSLLAICGEEAPRRLREIAAAVRPACYRYTLCLLLRPEGLPEHLGTRVLVVRDPTKPILEENALLISVGPALSRQPEQVPVWVECLVPATANESRGYLGVVRARVREELSRLLPFHERHLWVLASPHDGLPPELGIEVGPTSDRTAAPAPAPPLPMVPALSCDLPRMLGIGGAPHAIGVSNVLLASQENLPGLGREGAFVSGWGVARQIADPEERAVAQRREIFIEDS